MSRPRHRERLASHLAISGPDAPPPGPGSRRARLYGGQVRGVRAGPSGDPTADLTDAALLLACWGTPRGDGLPMLTAPPPAAIAVAVSVLGALRLVDDAGRADCSARAWRADAGGGDERRRALPRRGWRTRRPPPRSSPRCPAIIRPGRRPRRARAVCAAGPHRVAGRWRAERGASRALAGRIPRRAARTTHARRTGRRGGVREARLDRPPRGGVFAGRTCSPPAPARRFRRDPASSDRVDGGLRGAARAWYGRPRQWAPSSGRRRARRARCPRDREPRTVRETAVEGWSRRVREERRLGAIVLSLRPRPPSSAEGGTGPNPAHVRARRPRGADLARCGAGAAVAARPLIHRELGGAVAGRRMTAHCSTTSRAGSAARCAVPHPSRGIDLTERDPRACSRGRRPPELDAARSGATRRAVRFERADRVPAPDARPEARSSR